MYIDMLSINKFRDSLFKKKSSLWWFVLNKLFFMNLVLQKLKIICFSGTFFIVWVTDVWLKAVFPPALGGGGGVIEQHRWKV